MTPEGKVRAHLRKRALAAGLEHRKLRWIGRRGAPDELIFAKRGPLLMVLVEVKRPGEDVVWDSPQGREIIRLRYAGFDVRVIDSIEGADRVIDELTTLAKSQTVTFR